MKEITPDPDHSGYTIKARHWEPRNYLDAMKEVEASKKKGKYTKADGESRLGMQLMIGCSSGFALGGILLQKVLPIVKTQMPQYAELITMLLKTPLMVYGACVVVCAIMAYFVQSALGANDTSAETTKSSSAQSCHDIPPVGENGKMVSVEQMAIGGSGGSAAMNGETVEVETIRARYVVNAAGCYSVSELMRRVFSVTNNATDV